jgi:hypothetical protein
MKQITPALAVVRPVQCVIAAGVILLSSAVSARAAVYEFTLAGTVTNAPAGAVKVGDPFTVRYAVDAQDLAPESTDGLYTASGATINFPELDLVTADAGEFFVRPGDSTAPDLLHYLTYDASAWGVTINFQLPHGTLDSDSLPLNVQLSPAQPARLHVFWGLVLEDTYLGDVTSYTSVEVPEPGVLTLLLLTGMTSCRRRRLLGLGKEHRYGISGRRETSTKRLATET